MTADFNAWTYNQVTRDQWPTSCSIWLGLARGIMSSMTKLCQYRRAYAFRQYNGALIEGDRGGAPAGMAGGHGTMRAPWRA